MGQTIAAASAVDIVVGGTSRGVDGTMRTRWSKPQACLLGKQLASLSLSFFICKVQSAASLSPVLSPRRVLSQDQDHQINTPRPCSAGQDGC